MVISCDGKQPVKQLHCKKNNNNIVNMTCILVDPITHTDTDINLSQWYENAYRWIDEMFAV